MMVLGVVLAIGCRYQEPAPAPPPQQGYYPPGYYPPLPQQPGYYPPQPQQPGYYPPQPQPQPPQPQPQPQPQPTQPQPQPQQPPGSNPWLVMLGNLLSNPPPLPPGWLPTPPGPQPTPPTPPPGTVPPQPAGAVPPIGARALDLANAINKYRAQNGLPALPISRSLSFVADTHVRDLRDSPKLAPQCNGHSWSGKGSWSPCCYTPDHAQAKCMWNKPTELTPLKGTGFEITIGQPGETMGVVLDSQKAIAAWQGSPLHNDVILNRNTWAKSTWRSMGAGIVDSHACAWFSDQADPLQ